MRLLNVKTFSLKEFYTNIPHYVILSHTWEEDEVLFRDIENGSYQARKGWTKVESFCKEAARDGFEWVWIDSCCIDKSSSAELSEAINSMFLWYSSARVCFTYLADVERRYVTHQFPIARWFSRGWTLQELIAPVHVVFYDKTWNCLGSKHSFVSKIQRITGIDADFLLQPNAYLRSSIAQRFSWVSRRQTTRKEDMAYCLLGLVGINMSLLYGEGQRAFHRLQLEIVKQTTDCSIFAWSTSTLHSSEGLLAPWPDCFRYSNNYTVADVSEGLEISATNLSVTNAAIAMQMQIFEMDDTTLTALAIPMTRKGSIFALLPNVKFGRESVGMVLRRTQDTMFQRTNLDLLLLAGQTQPGQLNWSKITESAMASHPSNAFNNLLASAGEEMVVVTSDCIAQETTVTVPQSLPQTLVSALPIGYQFVQFPTTCISPTHLYWRTEIIAPALPELPSEVISEYGWDSTGRLRLPSFGPIAMKHRDFPFRHLCALRCRYTCSISKQRSEFIIHFDSAASVNMPYVTVSSTQQIDVLKRPLEFKSPVSGNTGRSRLPRADDQTTAFKCGCMAVVEGRETYDNPKFDYAGTTARVIDLCVFVGHGRNIIPVLERWEQMSQPSKPADTWYLVSVIHRTVCVGAAQWSSGDRQFLVPRSPRPASSSDPNSNHS